MIEYYKKPKYKNGQIENGLTVINGVLLEVIPRFIFNSSMMFMGADSDYPVNPRAWGYAGIDFLGPNGVKKCIVQIDDLLKTDDDIYLIPAYTVFYELKEVNP